MSIEIEMLFVFISGNEKYCLCSVQMENQFDSTRKLSQPRVFVSTFELVQPLVGLVAGECCGDSGEGARGNNDVDTGRQAAPRAPGQQAWRRRGRKQRNASSPSHSCSGGN